MSEIVLRSDYNESGVEAECFDDETQISVETNKSNEDTLLDQIEEFKEKAILLKQMTSDKQNQLASLEETIARLESENARLSEALESKQQAAVEIKNDVVTQVDRLMGEVQETFESFEGQIQAGFNDVCGDINESIHKENVRSYRNIQTLVENVDRQEEIIDKLGEKTKGLKGLAVTSLIFNLISIGGIAVLVLMQLGII